MPSSSEIYCEYDEKIIKPMINEVRKVLKFLFDGELTLRLATKNKRKSMSKRLIGYWNYIIVGSGDEIVGIMAISLYKSINLNSGYLLGIWLQLYEVALELEYGGKGPEDLSKVILRGIVKLLVYNLDDEEKIAEYLKKLNLE